MKRGLIIFVCAVGFLFLFSITSPRNISDTDEPTAGSAPQQARPNIILVSLDTLRPDHLGCYGYDKPTSPNLDKLARSGWLFTNCRAQAPWTLPSHMSLFTSMLPSHNRVEDLNEVLPADVTTLPQILKQAGYVTAAIVNNGQMKQHWGFGRGFDTWQEFEVDTPEGNCESITKHAIQWIEANEESPFLLFLHYFDVHEPYSAPKPYRDAFGVTVSGAQTREIMWRNRTPKNDLSAVEKKSVIDAYDAEIAWLDHELGKLFHAAPENTILVVFSDHGEAFDENGWTLHGATLFEEEVHTALIVAGKGIEPASVNRPVMLLDVAPTILELCGIDSPQQFEGVPLVSLTEGGSLSQRVVMSETKSVVEGTFMRTVIADPWKLVWTFPGQFELFKLPNEQTVIAKSTPLHNVIQAWNAENGFALITAVGKGRHEVKIKYPPGSLLLSLPIGMEAGRDHFMPAENGAGLHWIVHPDETPKYLYLEFASETQQVNIDSLINDERSTENVRVASNAPAGIPFDWDLSVAAGPAESGSSIRMNPGLHFDVFRSKTVQRVKPAAGQLDEATLKRLRSLGYLQ